MATVTEIHNNQLEEAMASPQLSQLTSTSKVSLFRLFFFNIAYAISLLREIFEEHKKEVKGLLDNERLGRKNWYKQKMLDFQYGFDLIPDTDIFINRDATEEEIEESKIITHAAIVEPADKSGLIVKIATGIDQLEPANEEQQIAVEKYLDEIIITGTRATLINQAHDQLIPYIDIYRDPLQIDSSGVNILTGERPVETAFNNYLKQKLPFNGQLTLQALADKIQLVDGVEIVDILNVETASVNPSTGVYSAPLSINVRHIPASGYYRVVTFENIRYVV